MYCVRKLQQAALRLWLGLWLGGWGTSIAWTVSWARFTGCRAKSSSPANKQPIFFSRKTILCAFQHFSKAPTPTLQRRNETWDCMNCKFSKQTGSRLWRKESRGRQATFNSWLVGDFSTHSRDLFLSPICPRRRFHKFWCGIIRFRIAKCFSVKTINQR